MPAPTTADELLDLLQKSNLVEEARLSAYVEKQRAGGTYPADPNKLAQFLVRDALLTFFQAEQLLQGKYKRFSLGKYKVLEKLGSGGMGTVFLCEHKLMRRRVAVKVLPVPKAEDDASLKRFYREAKAAAAVDHPNIVRAYDIDQDDNLHFIVMEWVDGTNLQDLVKKFGPMDPLRACHYMYGAAVGLQHAHEIGLLHRDIKPGNILIDRSGVVKILDLGLARLTHDHDDQLTRQNDENVLGTADYLAPEQALDSHTVDIRADIYSLGATFYYLLSGSPPFPEGSVAQKLIWHQNRPPRPLKSLRAEVPDGLVAIIDKMMAKGVEKRYQTPAELMKALAPWVATPIPPPSERELPALSPAVAGGQGGARVPAATGPASLAGYGRAVAPATVTGMPTAVLTAPDAPTEDGPGAPAVWQSLGADTQDAARGDTDRPDRDDDPPVDEERPSRVKRRAPAHAGKSKGKSKALVLGLIGLVLLAGAGAGVYFGVIKKQDGDPGTVTPPPAPPRITVSQAGGENTYKSLREALLRAKPGDTIVITDAKITEPVLRLDRNKHKDITIESATPDGKPAVIEFFAPKGAKGGIMFDVPSVDGVKVRNVEFDGVGVADVGVQISGIAAGVTFEGVTVRRVAKNGFNLWNLTGAADRPVVLDRVRVVLGPSGEAGVLSWAQVQAGVDNRYIAIKNSRFEGPGRSGVRFDGPTMDAEITNNRFYNLTAAISFVNPRPSRGAITNNTVFQAQIGLQFEVPAKDATPYSFKVAQNYFANTGALIQAPGPVTALTSELNLHNAASQPGSPPLSSAKLDAPTLPAPKPDEDDATFLRFPATGFPTAGPNKARVGAQ
ncbi:MAG: hypothetical protein FJ304_22070 [Planctomycetes bacterium]|nr:hypothetical protein [Planctomycetota bacterium]